MAGWILVLVLVVFFAGLYTVSNYTREGFGPRNPRCPNILIQDGEQLILKNDKLADIPGVNPIRFQNLEEYTEFVRWQQSQGITCPVLFYKKIYDAQSHEGYLPSPLPIVNDNEITQTLENEDADNPPYSMETYPSMDTHNQDIGEQTTLNEYHYVGETMPVSANPLDSNWGGANFSMKAIESGDYRGNEVWVPKK